VAFLGLKLQHFDHPGRLTGGRHQLQGASLVLQQQPALVHAQQLHATAHELVQQLHQVVVGYQRVGEGNEAFGNDHFPGLIWSRPSRLLLVHVSSSENRRRPATISAARSLIESPSLNAAARSRANASAMSVPVWAITIPAAWCTTMR